MLIYNNVLAIPADKISAFGEWLRSGFLNPCEDCEKGCDWCDYVGIQNGESIADSLNAGEFDTHQQNGVVYITNLDSDVVDSMKYWLNESCCIPCSRFIGFDDDESGFDYNNWNYDVMPCPCLDLVQGVEIK